MPITADELRRHFLTAWGADTCYPDMSEEWTPENPSRDQCGMTALVAQDILGGDLIIAEVHVEGAQIGHHYWNRLPDGSEVDLTADQFRPDEEVIGGKVIARPPDVPGITASSTNSFADGFSKRWPPLPKAEARLEDLHVARSEAHSRAAVR